MVGEDRLRLRAEEAKCKVERLREYLFRNQLGAAVIGRLDNFAWLTGGGDPRVVNGTEYGFAIAVVTGDNLYLVAQTMDGQRIMDEEVRGQGFEYVPLRWYEESREERALRLAGSAGVVSDVPLEGTVFDPAAFYRLHYPLVDLEVSRLKELSIESEEILTSVASEVEPGMTELEVRGLLEKEYGQRGFFVGVMLVGSDDRVSRYRHFNPSQKRIESWLVLSPAVRKGGLHANVARTISFGEPDPELMQRYEAVCQIEAATLAACKPGVRFADILSVQKAVYEETGYADEWRDHYQGGITGYMVSDPTLCCDETAVVTEGMAFDWFITISGAKGEELAANPGGRMEVFSVGGGWPSKRYEVNGEAFYLPEVLRSER